MALREDQVVRYSRQILLREIGGRGQEQLLATSVIARSGGAAIGTAAAYLAASGVAVLLADGRLVEPSEAGLLTTAADAGSPATEVVGRAIQDVNPDAAGPQEPWVWLGEAPAPPPEWPLPRLVMGGTEAGAAIVFGRSAADWEHLWRQAPSRAVPAELADEVGALAALIIQRWVLGIEPEAGRVEVDSAGVARLAAGS
ncbi:MAG TPA: ThiF family adenylyltransferase [Myxococcaceae bacterium]|nr:ThiF family adenylyltransferase [Myxococcaceae bacterium]